MGSSWATDSETPPRPPPQDGLKLADDALTFAHLHQLQSLGASEKQPAFELGDIDLVMQDAIAGKFLDKPLTKEQLSEFIQIPPR